MNDDVRAVLDELDFHRFRFQVFCQSLRPDELDLPVPGSTWLVRDFIAHLATIDRPIAEMFRTVHEGGDPGIRTPDGERFDVDSWNERQVMERRDRTVGQLLYEAAEARVHLREQLARLTDADLDVRIKFAGDARRPPAEVELRRYLRGWCKHDPMHAFDMLRAMPERMTPPMRGWFDDPVVQQYQRVMNPGS